MIDFIFPCLQMACTRCLILVLCCAVLLSQIAIAEGKVARVPAINADAVNAAHINRRLLQFFGLRQGTGAQIEKLGRGVARMGRGRVVN